MVPGTGTICCTHCIYRSCLLPHSAQGKELARDSNSETKLLKQARNRAGSDNSPGQCVGTPDCGAGGIGLWRARTPPGAALVEVPARRVARIGVHGIGAGVAVAGKAHVAHGRDEEQSEQRGARHCCGSDAVSGASTGEKTGLSPQCGLAIAGEETMLAAERKARSVLDRTSAAVRVPSRYLLE